MTLREVWTFMVRYDGATNTDHWRLQPGRFADRYAAKQAAEEHFKASATPSGRVLVIRIDGEYRSHTETRVERRFDPVRDQDAWGKQEPSEYDKNR